MSKIRYLRHDNTVIVLFIHSFLATYPSRSRAGEREFHHNSHTSIFKIVSCGEVVRNDYHHHFELTTASNVVVVVINEERMRGEGWMDGDES